MNGQDNGIEAGLSHSRAAPLPIYRNQEVTHDDRDYR